MALVQRVHETSGAGAAGRRPDPPARPGPAGQRPAGPDAGPGRRRPDLGSPGCTGEPAPDRPGRAGVLPRPHRGAAAGLRHERAPDAGRLADERPAGRSRAAAAAGRLRPPSGALHHRPPGRAHRGGGPEVPVQRPPAMCFLDLAGYTAHRGARRPGGGWRQPGRPGRAGVAPPRRPAGQVARRRGHVPLQAARAGGGGRPGDGRADPQAGLPRPVGLHAGPVVFQDGDYFGRTVNLPPGSPATPA